MERQWKPSLMLQGCETMGSTKTTVVSSAFLPLLYKGMQIGEICWLLWANPLHEFRLLENHSRTENKPHGQKTCLNYTQCWFICCQEYVIECLMDSLFISELTLLNIYIIKPSTCFQFMKERVILKVLLRGWGYFSLCEPILKNILLQNQLHQLKVNTRPEHLCLVKI